MAIMANQTPPKVSREGKTIPLTVPPTCTYISICSKWCTIKKNSSLSLSLSPAWALLCPLLIVSLSSPAKGCIRVKAIPLLSPCELKSVHSSLPCGDCQKYISPETMESKPPNRFCVNHYQAAASPVLFACFRAEMKSWQPRKLHHRTPTLQICICMVGIYGCT